MLTRSLNAEMLKLKRTMALPLVFLAPAAIVALTIFMASQAPFTTLHRIAAKDDWPALTRVNFQLRGLLMLPLYITLQTAIVAGVDHSGNQWKALFARPVPRWTVYVAKLLVLLATTTGSAAILFGGIRAAGALLHALSPEARFGTDFPFATVFTQSAQMTGLTLLPLAIQHWVSLRFRSFAVAVGFGIAAMVTSFVMQFAGGQYDAWPHYFPWALPMLVVAKQPHDLGAVVLIGLVLAIVASVVGCVDFCGRDVS